MSINIASPIRGFFEEHLVSQRGLSPNTVLSYRDTLKLLLQFAVEQCRKECTDLTMDDLNAHLVRQFLEHLERARKNGAGTRNVRLAAIHAFFRYLATTDPRLLAHCQSILAVPFKRHARPVAGYLEQEEVQHIFRHIDIRKSQGRRDDALLRLLYNSGARAQEIVDLNVHHVRFTRPYCVRIRGKGQRERTSPLWPETVQAIKASLEERHVRFSDNVPLFVNARGHRLTRYGLRYLIAHRVAAAVKTCPSLLTRTVTPHTWRHSTAMHLLQSGTDFNMIRSWLGHASIETTNLYVEIDLEMKQKTLQSCEKLLPKTGRKGPSWKRDPSILDWLSKL
ncbi:MAG: Tyrosine recombinase XerD [Syntrophorhabdaceae bacterium PtaU1.Bin034]|jgi:site-specific recombinase XerD|nr:MAG: Tyrosine recombinase XerD [Syntrophorhabdaceae bacterium PtaU1.Bin034]